MALTEAYRNHLTRPSAHAWLLNHRGYSMASTHELFEVKHETVSRWLQRCQSEGLTGFLDQERSDRPPILDDTDVGVLLEAIDRPPHQIKVTHTMGCLKKRANPVSPDTVKRK